MLEIVFRLDQKENYTPKEVAGFLQASGLHILDGGVPGHENWTSLHGSPPNSASPGSWKISQLKAAAENMISRARLAEMSAFAAQGEPSLNGPGFVAELLRENRNLKAIGNPPKGIVVSTPGDDDFHACLENHPDIGSSGSSAAEAVGCLIQTAPGDLGVFIHPGVALGQPTGKPLPADTEKVQV